MESAARRTGDRVTPEGGFGHRAGQEEGEEEGEVRERLGRGGIPGPAPDWRLMSRD